MKWVTIEKSKYSKKTAPKTKAAKKRLKIQEQKHQKKLDSVKKEVLVEVIKVRKQKQIAAKKVEKQRLDYIYKINDRVRLIDSNAIGTIEKIEKNKVIINYGSFTTKTNLDKLELVESSKNKP